MNKKALFFLLVFTLLFSFAVPAFAYPVSEVKTFGHTDERNRDGNVNGNLLNPYIIQVSGPSYSQPLILDGERWGDGGLNVIITIEGNALCGYVGPKNPDPVKQEFMPKRDFGPVQLSGDTPTISYPTYVEKGGLSDGTVIAPDQPVEFQLGEEKKATVTVQAQ